MRNVNHKEDFPLSLTLRDSKERPIRVPDYDFTVKLRAGAVEYFAGRFNGRLLNCRVSRHDDCTLVIFCNNHGFPPCRELEAEVTYHVPDADYSDRTRKIVRRQPTGVCLTVQQSDLPGYGDFLLHPEGHCCGDAITRQDLDDLIIRLSQRPAQTHRSKPPRRPPRDHPKEERPKDEPREDPPQEHPEPEKKPCKEPEEENLQKLSIRDPFEITIDTAAVKELHGLDLTDKTRIVSFILSAGHTEMTAFMHAGRPGPGLRWEQDGKRPPAIVMTVKGDTFPPCRPRLMVVSTPIACPLKPSADIPFTRTAPIPLGIELCAPEEPGNQHQHQP